MTLSSVVKATITPFSDAAYEKRKAFYYKMNKGIDILLIKTLGRSWFSKNASKTYTHVIPKDKSQDNWLCVLLDNNTVVTITVDTPESYAEAIGRYYGYDSCCIEEYMQRKTIPVEERTRSIEGFFPCRTCKEKPINEVINAVNQRRASSFPYPRSSYATDCVDMLHKIINGKFPVPVVGQKKVG